MNKILKLTLPALAVTTLLTAPNLSYSKNLKMAVVVKIGGIPWFNAMQTGIIEEGKKLHIDASMVGPTSADPALQVKAIEDLIAKNVDVIGVVPNDAKVLEPVLKRAKAKGILVITHESPNQKFADYDFEMVGAKTMGEIHMKQLASQMGSKGKYAIIVGSLTVPVQNAWADAAVAYQKKHYPNMSLVVSRFGGGESVNESMDNIRNLLLKEQDLKGIIAFASQGPIGAARAVQKSHKKGIKILGLWSPSQGKRLFKQKLLTGGYMWNPMEAGRVFVRLAKRIKIDKQLPKSGEDVAGLKNIKLENNTILASAPEDLSDPATVKRLASLGL